MTQSIKIPTGVNIYMDKPYIKIYFDSNKGVLFGVFKGFATLVEVEAIGRRMIEAVNREKVQKVLFDTRLIEVLDKESEKFISTTYTNQMISAGVEYSATVMPKDIFAQLSLDNIQKTHFEVGNPRISYFESITKALKWLAEH